MPTPPRRTVAEASAAYRAANPPKPTLTEAGHAAAAAQILEELKSAAKPLHEMSADESIARRNEGWAGIIPDRRPSLTISEWLAQ